MVEEFLQVVVEEIFGAAFSGAFRRARSRKARMLKVAAWAGFASSAVAFLAAWKVAGGNGVAIAFGVGGILAFFFFGAWTAGANACAENNDN